MFPQLSAPRDGVITVFQAIVPQSWTARRLCSQGYLLLEVRYGRCVLRAAHLGEGKQEGESRLRALVSVDTVDMQAVPATTTLSIIERDTEIVASVKPFKCLVCLREPIAITSSLMSLETGANRRMGFDGLLVERRRLFTALPEAVGTNWAEVPLRSDLTFRKPMQTLETNLAKIRADSPSGPS